jgi:hypothetical protein
MKAHTIRAAISSSCITKFYQVYAAIAHDLWDGQQTKSKLLDLGLDEQQRLDKAVH